MIEVGDIVEIFGYSPTWDGTTGKVISIHPPEGRGVKSTVKLQYLTGHKAGTIDDTESGGWYLGEHMRKIDVDEILVATSKWVKFFK